MQIVNVFVLKNQSLFIARRGRGGGVAKALVRMQRNEGMGGGVSRRQHQGRTMQK